MKNDKIALVFKGLAAYLAGVLVLGMLFFIPAGTIYYEGGLRLMALLFVPMLLVGVVLFVCSPDLLARRLNAKEKRAMQSGVVRLSGLIFVAGFVVAGLDFRFGWSCVNTAITTIASVVFLVGYGLYMEVMRENVWLSRTVEISEGQQVISTGLYGIVRHPMYLATLLMFLSMPLVLGSWWALMPLLCYIPIIVVRTLDEERLLCQELRDYTDYCQRVRWRLVPFVW